jgi:Ca2+-binding RTX toxin-like protein
MLATLAAAAGLALAAAAPARASFDACTYDAPTRTVTATLETSHDGTLRVGAGGEIESDSTPCGAASTANTDAVEVSGSRQSDTVTLDQNGPGGRFVKPGTSNEIHFGVYMNDETFCDPSTGCSDVPQVLRVIGTPADDDIRVGRDYSQTLINLDGASDVDPDIRASGAQPDVWGGRGDDTLTGLGGSGAGAEPANVTLRGGPGDDTLVTAGDHDVIYPGAGQDDVFGSPGGGDMVSYEGAPGQVRADVSAGRVYADGFGDWDALDDHVRWLRGSNHDDTLVANYPALGEVWQRLEGAGGDDRIVGSPGHEILFGGAGDDSIDAERPGDSYEEGDRIWGGPGDDVIRGGAGPDDLRGGFGDDLLKGGRGKVRSDRGAFPFNGGDSLRGGPGSDWLEGGQDPDWYVFDPVYGRDVDTIVERPDEGRDTLDFEYNELDYVGRPQIATDVDLSSHTRRFATSGTRVIRTADRGGARYLENVLIGGFADDRIVGNGAPNVIKSGSGADTVDCRGSRDVVDADEQDRIANCEVVKPPR